MSRQYKRGTVRREFSLQLHRSSSRSDESFESLDTENEQRTHSSFERSESQVTEQERIREFETWASEYRSEVTSEVARRN